MAEKTLCQFFIEVCGRELSLQEQHTVSSSFGDIADCSLAKVTGTQRRRFLASSLACLSTKIKSQDRIAELLRNLELRLSAEMASRAFESMAKGLPQPQKSSKRPQTTRVARWSERLRAESSEWRASSYSIDKVSDLIKARTETFDRSIGLGFSTAEATKISSCLGDIVRVLLDGRRSGELAVERESSGFREGIRVQIKSQGQFSRSSQDIKADLKDVEAFADELLVTSSQVTMICWLSAKAS